MILSHEHSELLPQVDGLRATPLWEIEKTGQAIHLEKIQDNWVVIRWAKYTAGKSVQFCCLGPSQGSLQEGAEKLDTGD